MGIIGLDLDMGHSVWPTLRRDSINPSIMVLLHRFASPVVVLDDGIGYLRHDSRQA